VDKEALLKPRLPEADVEIPGVGTVRVRGLSRYEVLLAQKEQSKGPGAMERVILRFGMVDPAMTEDEVAQWQKASPAGELEPVARKIQALSGIGEGAEKAAYKSDGGEPAP
jgi:hypothetical protein